MNEKIYVIISGVYSEWEIMGFADTEFEAIQICAKHNQNKDPRYGDWYYKEAKKLGDSKPEIALKYTYEFFCVKRNGKYVLTDDLEIHFCGEKSCERSEVEISDYGDGGDIWMFVTLREFNKEKARKIAQDKLAEYNYKLSTEGFKTQKGAIGAEIIRFLLKL